MSADSMVDRRCLKRIFTRNVLPIIDRGYVSGRRTGGWEDCMDGLVEWCVRW